MNDIDELTGPEYMSKAGLLLQDSSQASAGRQHALVSNKECLLYAMSQAAKRHRRVLALHN